ncbi:HPr kinase/phosphorylase [Halorhodospira halochloris]|uniref:HPr kinase/phosphorylase n=1 Tax=Halorhodospira halochloris TaxID=1052 RepID=UPI001EE788A0|nr:hypothetical protein [Halorhodospira halochloris]MCG5548113.1 hypothetical protein [Halorhodospira halochloris]
MSLSKSNDGTIIPGVLMHINGRGVLLRGPSGVGKSDCALAMIQRGHLLVADDAVLIKQQDSQLIGSCPQIGFGLIHLRDLGIVDIREIYGAQSLSRSSRIDLQITLTRNAGSNCPISLIKGRRHSANYCGTIIPALKLTAVEQRPLAELIEIAVAQLNSTSEKLSHQDIPNRITYQESLVNTDFPPFDGAGEDQNTAYTPINNRTSRLSRAAEEVAWPKSG